MKIFFVELVMVPQYAILLYEVFSKRSGCLHRAFDEFCQRRIAEGVGGVTGQSRWVGRVVLKGCQPFIVGSLTSVYGEQNVS